MRNRRVRPWIKPALGASVVAVVAIVAAWFIDSGRHKSEVFPNAVIADKNVRGMDHAELAGWAHTVAEQFATATVDVRTPGENGGFQATVPELGVAVDEERTVAAALAEGKHGAAPARIVQWLRSMVSPVHIPVAVKVDRRTIERIVAERDKARTAPVEPDIAVKDGHLDGVAGKNGRGVDPAKLADALARSKPTAGTPLVVTVDISSVPPRFSEDEADRLAGEAETLAKAGLPVSAGGKSATVPAESLRAWVHAVPGEEALKLALKDDAEVVDGLAGLLPEAGTPAVDAGFTVSGGRVSITESKAGTACCAAEAMGLINAALGDPAKWATTVDLPLKPVAASRTADDARKLGIVEQVATFTTPHNAGEPRVTNIHTMADTVRGTVIPPGGTFSINDTVGRRTKEKGYVEAPIISGD